MPVELRKRAAPPPAAPPAKKKAPSKPKSEQVALKSTRGLSRKTAAYPPPPRSEPETSPEPEPAPAPIKSSGGLPKSEQIALKSTRGLSRKTAAYPPPPRRDRKTSPKPEPAPAPIKSSGGPPKAGESIDLDGFGGEVETNDGEKTTLAELVESSEAGVVLFTYPKASTPGCTNQACMFRDQYEPLTAGGLSIFGLSSDSPKANTTFKTKQKLPYALLCDPALSLIAAIGMKKAPKGTTRGVFVVDKSGKVLAAEPGSPAGTVDVVKKLVADMEGGVSATVEDEDSAA